MSSDDTCRFLYTTRRIMILSCDPNDLRARERERERELQMTGHTEYRKKICFCDSLK